MKAGAVLLGVFAVVSITMIVTSGNISGAEFPSIGELFGSDGLNYPDFSIGTLFGFAQELTEPGTFSSVASLSGFFEFLGDTFSGLVNDPGAKSIGGIAMLLCILVIVLCLLSAVLGTMKGRKFLRNRDEE